MKRDHYIAVLAAIERRLVEIGVEMSASGEPGDPKPSARTMAELDEESRLLREAKTEIARNQRGEASG